jgi:hypothetical protein
MGTLRVECGEAHMALLRLDLVIGGELESQHDSTWR